MRVVPSSINPNYTLIEKKVIQIKTTLHLPEQKVCKYATGKALTGEHKDKIVLYISYDQIEINSISNRFKPLFLVPTPHVMCVVEPEDDEHVTDPINLPEENEPWMNLNK